MNVAATGRSRSATGSAFLMTGITFFFRKFFWSGEVAIKSTEEEEEKFIFQSRLYYTVVLYIYVVYTFPIGHVH
jgi:hypothetical protein